MTIKAVYNRTEQKLTTYPDTEDCPIIRGNEILSELETEEELQQRIISLLRSPDLKFFDADKIRKEIQRAEERALLSVNPEYVNMTREQITAIPTAEERRNAREAVYSFYDQVRKIKDKYTPALTQAMTIQAVRDAETEEEAMQWITPASTVLSIGIARP